MLRVEQLNTEHRDNKYVSVQTDRERSKTFPLLRSRCRLATVISLEVSREGS